MEQKKKRAVGIPKYSLGEEIFNAVSHGLGALLGAVIGGIVGSAL